MKKLKINIKTVFLFHRIKKKRQPRFFGMDSSACIRGLGTIDRRRGSNRIRRFVWYKK